MTATDTRTRPGSRDGARETRARGRRPVSTSPFFTSALDGAPRWAVGALTALQAALLSLLVLVLPAVTAYVTTSADPTNAGVGWLRSVRVGAALWLAGHGVPLHVAGVTIGLVPLGVTGLALFACYASARRSGNPSASAFAAGVGTYVTSAVLVTCVVAPRGGDVVRAVVGATLVSVLGLGGGLLRRPDAPSLRSVTRPVWSRVTPALRCGAAAGLLAATLLLLAAAALTLVWIVAGRATIGDVVSGLGVGGLGGVVYAVGELAFLPNLVVWALAWLAGPGFHVGAGTSFAPGGVVAAPMPAVPLLGALPTGGFAGGAARAVPALLVVVGMLAGGYVHRRLRTTRWTTVLGAVATAGVTTALLVLVLTAAAGGPAGPGRLAQVGTQSWLVALCAGGGVLLGAFVVAVPADASVRSALRDAVRRAAREPVARPVTDAAEPAHHVDPADRTDAAEHTVHAERTAPAESTVPAAPADLTAPAAPEDAADARDEPEPEPPAQAAEPDSPAAPRPQPRGPREGARKPRPKPKQPSPFDVRTRR